MKTEADLILAIVAAACEYRDHNWEKDDPSPVVDGIDKAVDAWRAYLRKNQKPEPFPFKEVKQ